MASEFIQWKNLSYMIERYRKLNPLLDKIVLSHTYEKREIFILSLVKNNENPAVVIIGGEQAKDWMSPAIIYTIIKTLITTKYDYTLDYYNFYFLPIFNPDGYVYSMVEVSIFFIINEIMSCFL